MLKCAIVGFGCAGYHAAKAIRQKDEGAIIDVYSDHSFPPYNPMLTTYYASNKLVYQGMFPFGDLEKIKNELKLNILTNQKVSKVKNHTVYFENGEKEYDKILIATGAYAFVPPINGLDTVNPDNVFCMRTLSDAIRLRDAVEKRHYKSAVVVGASMVGIKLVELLANMGVDTKLCDMAPYLFPLAAYPEVGKEIASRIESAFPVHMMFGAGLAGLTPDEKDTVDVHLTDNSVHNAELIVLCIGTRAATALVNPDEVKINRGIVVNTHMETSCPGVYAAGDCCEGINLQSNQTLIIGLWANAAKQGATAGANMAGGDEVHYGNILHNITHFMGMDFIGLGDNRIQGEVVEFGSLKDGLYVKAVVADGKLAGVNILDNYRISGPLKNYFTRLLEGRIDEVVPLQRGILQKEGLTLKFIDELEGKIK